MEVEEHASAPDRLEVQIVSFCFLLFSSFGRYGGKEIREPYYDAVIPVQDSKRIIL